MNALQSRRVVGLTSLFLVLVMVFAIRVTVTRPLVELRTVSEKIANGDFKQRVLNKSQDEIGQLAQIFNQMAHNVVKREEKLKQEVHQLRIEIDEVKRKQQVEEITGTEYFSELQKRAREMRRGLSGEGLTPAEG